MLSISCFSVHLTPSLITFIPGYGFDERVDGMVFESRDSAGVRQGES